MPPFAAMTLPVTNVCVASQTLMPGGFSRGPVAPRRRCTFKIVVLVESIAVFS
jgi:hypothetical protein